jgi:diketogulonate reductase-like aldo/keto reductase
MASRIPHSSSSTGIYFACTNDYKSGNHERFPKLPDGSRDLVRERSHIQTWKTMEKLLATGKVKAIGVANYSLRYLKQLLPEATIVPAVNQIENHPSLPQQEIVNFCHEKAIHVTAYSPLGSTGSPMMKEPAVVEVAEKKGVTPASVLLSYHSVCWLGRMLLRIYY